VELGKFRGSGGGSVFLTWDRTCLLSLLGDFYGARLLYGENVSEYCSTEKWAGEGDVVVKWRGTLPPCTKSLAQAGQPNQHAPALAFPLPTFRSSDSLCRPATLLVYLACDAQIFTRTPHLSPTIPFTAQLAHARWSWSWSPPNPPFHSYCCNYNRE